MFEFHFFPFVWIEFAARAKSVESYFDIFEIILHILLKSPHNIYTQKEIIVAIFISAVTSHILVYKRIG